MKDAYEVLKQKETDLDRVRREIESLRVVASLLVDSTSAKVSDDTGSTPEEKIGDADTALEPTGSDGLSSSGATSASGIWKVLKRK